MNLLSVFHTMPAMLWFQSLPQRLSSSERVTTFCKALLAVSVLLALGTGSEAKANTPPCSVCRDITKNFHKGLASTAKSNYGGGNTKWEEKSLGSYAYSEVRLVEIMEHLCGESEKDCHRLLEEHEDTVERYWFKEFAQKKDTDFFTYFCIDHIKVCCGNNTYGKDCSVCPGGVERPCSGNGKCDGAGTRDGTGQCRCHSGYKGELCLDCVDGHFEESRNETHSVCKVCHISCKNTCSEGGAQGCNECKDGWLADEELGCQDVNECAEDPCEENQYCTNTQGSYTCFSCHSACMACTGSGPGKCTDCNPGYTLNPDTNICSDDNECEKDPNICKEEHRVCMNTPGSYECICQSDYHFVDDKCVPVPKDSSRTQRTETTFTLGDKTKNKRRETDWSKFKDIPSIGAHFLVMALYGISSRFAASSQLAMAALSLLMVIHVIWFAANCI